MALDQGRVMLGRADGKVNFATYSFPVANGVTVTAGDFVYFASGRITSASIGGARCVGMVTETATGNSGGTVKAIVCVDPLMRYLLKNDNDSTTFAASHVGTNFDLIGATGAQLVDTSTTGTTGQLLCLEYNPQIDPVKSDTTYGVFILAEHIFYTGTGAQ
jgi:hypothetical protein